MLCCSAVAEPITFHCYPPGTKVYKRGSSESFLGNANELIDLPPLEGSTFYEVVIRHPDGEHLEKIERPLVHQRDWPGTGQITLEPKNNWVRAKDWVRYPTAFSYLLGTTVFCGFGFLLYRGAKVGRAQMRADRDRSQAAQRMALAERAQQEQERAQREAERRGGEARLAKVAQDRGRQQAQQEQEKAKQEQAVLALRHQALDQAQTADPWIGLRAGSYVAVNLLGKGASGKVYAGQLAQPHPSAPQMVAIKVIETDEKQTPEQQARFMSEIEVGKLLNHTNIVGYYGVTRVQGAICIFQELVAGGATLREIEKQAPLPVAEVLRWLHPVALALDYMHSQKVYHRDLKPENIMITSDGVPKIADLGLAKKPDSTMTQTYEMHGTPAYLAPEQCLDFRSVDGRADQYSLGCIVYQLLSSTLPFSGDVGQVLTSHLNETPKDIPGVTDRINQVVMRMLKKDRTHRFPTCLEALHALETADNPALSE